MKRFCLFISFILAGMAAVAQDDVYGTGKKEPRPVEIDIHGIELTSEGAYERKEVVDVDGVNAAVLYDRAMMALSDWTGPDGKAKAGIDYQNQETHTVIYKGTFSLGFKNVFLGDGWNRYANFTVKVRCKDGRAQVTVTVAQMTVIYNRGNLERSYTIGKVLDAVKKSKGDKRKRGEMLMADIVETADGMIAAMGVKLKAAADSGDDF